MFAQIRFAGGKSGGGTKAAEPAVFHARLRALVPTPWMYCKQAVI